jgi:hypothetical protein|tara:strand:+ start:142 stop:501 length:360 start_codon:yes stop_codon:yes gene_type:complete
MKKFLYFSKGSIDGTTSTEEVACFPADKLSHMEMQNTGDLRLFFESGQETDNDAGLDHAVVALDITVGKHKEIMEAITGAIASANAINSPFIVVADSENSKFLHANITACASISVVEAS